MIQPVTKTDWQSGRPVNQTTLAANTDKVSGTMRR